MRQRLCEQIPPSRDRLSALRPRAVQPLVSGILVCGLGGIVPWVTVLCFKTERHVPHSALVIESDCPGPDRLNYTTFSFQWLSSLPRLAAYSFRHKSGDRTMEALIPRPTMSRRRGSPRSLCAPWMCACASSTPLCRHVGCTERPETLSDGRSSGKTFCNLG